MLKKRILSVILCLCMVVGMLPVITLTAQAVGTGVVDKLNELRSKYPNGAYWNHYVSSQGQDHDSLNKWDETYANSVTNTPCYYHGKTGETFSGSYVGHYDCNRFDGGGQCWGFANKIFYDVFGVKRSTQPSDNRENVKPGDYVRFGTDQKGHSAVVLTRNGNEITLVECNVGPNCQISWGRKEYISNVSYCVHAPQDVYDRVNGTAANYAYTQDLGSDFYAYIYNPMSGCNLENRSNNVQLASVNGSDPRQIWHFTRQDETSYKIINMYDGRCLDTSGPEGAHVVQTMPYVGNELQKWRFYGLNNTGPFYVAPYRYNSDHAYVLDVANYGTTPGTNIQLIQNSYKETGDFQIAQTFQVNKVSESEVASLLASNLGSDFYSRIEFNGTYLQTTGPYSGSGSVWSRDVRTTTTLANDPQQIWHFIRQSNGSYKIRNEHDDWCLDVSGGIAQNNQNIWVWRENLNNTSSRNYWYLIRSPGDSTYRVASALKYPSELYSLDIPNSSTDEDTNVELFSQQWGANQQFAISSISYTRPDKPAEPANVRVRTISDTITVTWDAVPLSESYDNRRYDVWIQNDDDPDDPETNFYQSTQGTSCEFNVTLPVGQYTVGVSAVNTMYYAYYSNDSTVDFTIAPEPATYTVGVNATTGGTASGGGTCQDGASMTVTATPNEGYHFVKWTENGSEVSTNASYTFIVSTDHKLTAVFEEDDKPTPTYTVNVTASPTVGGSVSGGGTYDEKTSVTVIATPAAGYQFKEWTENSSRVSISASYTFDIDTNRILTAVFEKTAVPTYSVSVTANPVAGGTVTGSGTYQSGTSVNVRAVANSDYQFVEWRADGSRVSSDATYTFTISKNLELVAVFEKKEETPPTPPPPPTPTKYTISVTASPTEGGSVSGGGRFEDNTSITVTATPNAEYEFKGWVENGAQVSTAADYTFIVSADRTLTATFEKKEEDPPTPPTPVKYTINVSANPTSGGSVSGGNTYESGASVTVMASPSSNYKFTGWSENGQQVSINSSYTFTADSDRTLVAMFSYTGGSSSTGTPSTSTTNPGSTHSGGSTTTPASSLPVSTAETTSNTTATTASPAATTKGDTATVAISSAVADEIIKQAVSNNSDQVIISPVIKGDVAKVEVTVPASVLDEVGQKTDAALLLSTPVADIAFTNKGLSSLSNHGAVTVTADTSGNAIALTITAGGQAVDSVSGGITLTLPIEQSTPGIVAVLVHDDGTRQIIRKSVASDDSIIVPLDGSAKLEIIDNAKPFSDVPVENWATDAVAFASAHELFNGTSSNTFSPDLPMTRGMLTVVLHNLENNPGQDFSAAFSDVAGGTWYSDAVAWAAEQGIVSGYGNGLFGPGDNITREQLAVMLWRYDGEPAATNKELRFSDADNASGYALDALRWAVENGVINGYGNGILDPKGLATRAQVAQMLMNYQKK